MAGLALLLVIAVLVTGRVLLGTFLPGLLLVAVIAIIAVTVAVRSGQPVPRKVIIVTATVLVVAVAVPASLRVIYPVYHHFFGDGTNQASPSPRSPSSNSSTAPSSAPTGSPNAGAAQYKIILNGQTLANAGNRVSCAVNEIGLFEISVGVRTSLGTSFVDLSQDTPPKVSDVNIITDTSDQYIWERADVSGRQRGDAQVTKSGKTYNISGHIAPWYNFNQHKSYDNAPLVPFEFDATCP